MEQRDLQIIAQNAGTTAGAIYVALHGNEPWDAAKFEAIRGEVFYGALQLVAEAQVVKAIPGATPEPAPQGRAFEGPRAGEEPFPNPNPVQHAQPPAAAGKPDRCKKCGGDRFFDNREKKASGQYSPKAPDWKCANKECGTGVWSTPYQK